MSSFGQVSMLILCFVKHDQSHAYSVQVKQDNTLKQTEMFLFVNISSFIQIVFLKLNCT